MVRRTKKMVADGKDDHNLAVDCRTVDSVENVCSRGDTIYRCLGRLPGFFVQPTTPFQLTL